MIKDDVSAHHDPAYKLILMDCNMPFMDGYTCATKIREFYSFECGIPPLQQPVISAVTGHTEPQYVKRCFESGMNQVLSKPIKAEALKFVCREVGLLT